MKRLINFLMFIFLASSLYGGEVGQYLIYSEQFSETAFDSLIRNAVLHTKEMKQPADRVRFVIKVSTNISENGILRTDYRAEDIDFGIAEKVYMECDITTENNSPLGPFMKQGKVDKLGSYTYTREDGFNRDSDDPKSIYQAQDRYYDTVSPWIVEVSTP